MARRIRYQSGGKRGEQARQTAGRHHPADIIRSPVMFSEEDAQKRAQSVPHVRHKKIYQTERLKRSQRHTHPRQ